MLLPMTISIVYTYMHALVSCRPGPDGVKLWNSHICLRPLKECLKTTPIPSGCHQNAQRQRHTICSRHHGQTPFLSVHNFNPPHPIFLAILVAWSLSRSHSESLVTRRSFIWKYLVNVWRFSYHDLLICDPSTLNTVKFGHSAVKL